MIDPFRSGATGIACAAANPVSTAPATKAATIKFFMRFLPALANLDGYGVVLAGSFYHAAVKSRVARPHKANTRQPAVSAGPTRSPPRPARAGNTRRSW